MRLPFPLPPRPSLFVAGLAVLGAGSVGCHSTDAPAPRALDLALPPAFTAAEATAPIVAGAWWQALDSDSLDALVIEALANNHDLAAAAARIASAEAQARIAGSARKPAVGLNASRNRAKNIFVGLPVPGGNVLESTATQWGVSLDIAWEADLWGRLSSTVRAAEADAVATAFDFEAARQSLAAQTTKAWIAWRLAAGQDGLAARTLETYRRDLQLVQDRFEAGLASNFDLRLSRARLEGALAETEATDAAVEVAGRQLETIVGRYPAGELATEDELPGLPPLPGAGVPSELVQRRPDLRAAAMRVAGADARLDAARAERFPSFAIAASTGRVSDMFDDLSDDDFSVWSFLLSLAQPIYQGGRIDAGIDFADATALALLEGYAQTALIAFLEVESSLAVDAPLAAQEAALGRALEEARVAREIAEERYRAGLDDLFVVLEADRTALQAERTLLEVRARRLDARVDLHLALGGDIEPMTPASL
ncbi:MAG: efflux transporter outer membrane subunit [Planctomycetota bacterium]